MSDTQNIKRPLSEISHLFLSNVRDLPKPGAPRPQRIPPGAPRVESRPRGRASVDLSPEEFAQVFGEIDLDDERPATVTVVTALLASHLASRQAECVNTYARHYAAQHGVRIGLMEVDASEFRVTCFEPGVESHAEVEAGEGDSFEPRQMAEAIQEIAVDVDRWLLLVTNPRLPESRNLLRKVPHWTMLSTCDHDGMVSCYRTLKGLADLHRPRLSLALLDAPDAAEAEMIQSKLTSVCLQFLNWSLTHEPLVESAENVAEQRILNYRPLRDKAQLASGAPWQVVSDFLTLAEAPAVEPPQLSEPAKSLEDEMPAATFASPSAAGIGPPRIATQSGPAFPASSKLTATDDTGSDVVDLPSADAPPTAILSAIIRHDAGAMIECPVRPPMCPEATLAVDRERGLVLLAVAKIGLCDLRAVAQSFQWLNQNRSLIAMAMPQLAIDCHRLPRLQLLVDHRDMTADLLQPMLAVGHVTVQAYRKLRWGQRNGLLLDAA